MKTSAMLYHCLVSIHIDWSTSQDAGAKKTDARHDINHDVNCPGGPAVDAMHANRDVHEKRGAHRDQHLGAQASGALTILALQPDHAPEHKGGGQAQDRVGQRGEAEGFNLETSVDRFR